jgi:hypothetical protein
MSSAAAGNPSDRSKQGRILTNRDLAAKLGDDPAVGRAKNIVSKWLDRGGGLGAAVVNKWNDDDSPYFSPREKFWGSMASASGVGQDESDNIAGLEGLRLGQGNVYLGSSSRYTPAQSHTDPRSGHSHTPGSTTFSPVVLPRSIFRQSVGGQAQPPAPDDKPQTPFTPSDATKEAVERASTAAQQYGASSSDNSWIGKSGGSLLQSVMDDADASAKAVASRFGPSGDWNLNRQATMSGINDAVNWTIGNLPSDLKISSYPSPRQVRKETERYMRLSSKDFA